MKTVHGCALLLGWTMAGCGLDQDEPEPPTLDVVLIVVDTLRADSLGCYGGREGVSPRLDELAEDGVRFARASSASGWTLPSVASLLTGTWPTLHKAVGKSTRLTPISPDVPTATELLESAGYRTVGVANAAFLSPLLGLARGFEEFDHQHAYNWEIRRADRSVDDALDLLSEDDERPSFLLLHLFDPHLDYDPPEEVRGLFTSDDDVPAPPLNLKQCRSLGDPGHPEAEKNARYLEGLYLEEVAFVDRQLGRLLDELKARGVYDDALIILTADHGEEFWEHGDFEHGHTLYEELVHVPLIVKPPRSVEVADAVVEDEVRVLDVMPTVFDLAGLSSPASFVGRSLLPLIRGEEEEPRRVLCEATLYGADKYVLREGSMKFIYDRKSAEASARELYDLSSDPDEQLDLSAQRPEVADRMYQSLVDERKALIEEARGLATPRVRDMNPREIEKIVEQLQSLGYVREDGR